MPKNLFSIKMMNFAGVKDQVDPLTDRNSLLQGKNVVSHVKPGILTARDPYELKYPAPYDAEDRIENGEFISFDNFYEKTAEEGVEVTVLVQKGEVVAPVVGGSKLTDFKYRGVQIWIRPCWTGFYWVDQWEWLNESWNTTIKTAPDATYKNKIVVNGAFSNVDQWIVVNVNKNDKEPVAILKAENDGTDTTLWLSLYNSDWEVDDDVVILRNYIPFDQNFANYYVDSRTIGFHRIFSKIRIGFGAQSQRVGLGVDYVNNVLALNDYAFSNVDPEIEDTEYIFATSNRMQLQTFIPFNQDNNFKDYKLEISEETLGSFNAGTYYFRMTAVLENASEILVVETEIEAANDNAKFEITPYIRLGSLNRRVTKLKVYFSETGDDYYYYRDFNVQGNIDLLVGEEIQTKNWLLLEDGYLQYKKNNTETNLYTETGSATSSDDANGVGTWVAFDTGKSALSAVAASNFAMRLTSTFDDYTNMAAILVNSALDSPGLEPGETYTLTVNMQGSKDLTVEFAWGKWKSKTEYFQTGGSSAQTRITTSPATYTLTLRIPFVADPIGLDEDAEQAIFMNVYGASAVGDYVEVESFEIEQLTNIEIDTDTELGGQDVDILGYLPTFNMVRDWENAVVINQITYVGAAFIEERYDNKIFASHIGSEANMFDAISAQTVLDVDRYRGEVIVNMLPLSNLDLLVFLDGGAIILDPTTGSTREVARGYGLKAKMSLVAHRGIIYWASDNDLVAAAASSGYEPDIITRDIRDNYRLLTDKSYCTGCYDEYGNFRIGFSTQDEEWLLTDRGWFEQQRSHNPVVFRNGLAGRVWFMNSGGNIYALPGDLVEDVGYADVYGDYRSGW